MDDDLLLRWPLAAAERRVPMYALRGSNDDSTSALIDRMYLVELIRQASIFDACFHEAMTAALVADDSEACWRHLQGALFAAVVVVRLLDPTGVQKWGICTARQAGDVARARAARLRSLVEVPAPGEVDLALYRLRPLRNAMEHVDERLDHITSEAGSVSDWYLSGGIVFLRDPAKQSAPLGLRSFDPTAGVLIIDDQALSLFQLNIEMLNLRTNAVEAIAVAESRVVGRSVFGGIRLTELAPLEQRLKALAAWEAQRGALLERSGPHRAGPVDNPNLPGEAL